MSLVPHIFDDALDRVVSESQAAWFGRICEAGTVIAGLQHRVPVRLLATETIYRDRVPCVGMFLYGLSDCEIWLAYLGHTKAAIVRALAHELVHYEQWRDGRDCLEPEAEALESRIANYILRVA